MTKKGGNEKYACNAKDRKSELIGFKQCIFFEAHRLSSFLPGRKTLKKVKILNSKDLGRNI